MKKILIVEDNELLQQTLKEALVAEGYEVVVEAQAKPVVARIKNDPPDLVLLDIMLPGGMNGFDLLEQLQADPFLAQIPVLVITNLGESEGEMAMKIGAKGYLQKANTSIEDMIATIKQYL